MQRVLLTGAAGGIGTFLRPLLAPIYPGLVLSDIRPPADLRPDETFLKADLAVAGDIERACAGMDGIIHLGGRSREAPWEDILEANIVGCYNLFEAARKAGVSRVIFATSNHAVGFYPRTTTIGPDVTARPDSRYGVSKLFGEGLGAMYAYKHGIGVTALRIGHVGPRPFDARRLAIWLRPDDLVRLIRIGLERPGLVYEVLYGVSDNQRSWYDNSRAVHLGYDPHGRSEDFAAAVLAAEPPGGDDYASQYYQGGTFCGDEYSADFEAMKRKS